MFIELSKRLDPAKYQIIPMGTDNSVDRHMLKNIISIQST